MPNPSNVVKRRGKDPRRTCLHQRGRRESCSDPQETTRSLESAKESCRQQEKRTQLWGRRFCLPQSLPNAWSQKIPSKREASSAIRWLISYHRQNRANNLPPSVTRIHVWYSQCISCISAPKMLKSTTESHRRGVYQIQKDLQYREKPVKILDSAIWKTWNSEVRLCKV